MLSCPRCGLVGFVGIRQVILHLASVHSCEPNFQVVCNFSKAVGSCCSIFHSVASFRSHIYKYHSNLLFGIHHDDCTVTTEIRCPVCGDVFSSLRDVSSHYREHCEHGIAVQCLVKHCDSTFNVISSYTAHMSRMHKNVSIGSLRDELFQQVRAEESEVSNEVVTSDGFDTDAVQDIDRPDIKMKCCTTFLKNEGRILPGRQYYSGHY